MTTYQDYQKLADAGYGSKEIIEALNNPNDTNDKTIWTKVTSHSNILTGYYGALYKSNSGEYVMVNRGTEVTTSIPDLINDAQMWKSKIPDQYTDARKFYQEVIQIVGSGIFSIAGHSLGASLSQMLSVEYGNYAVTFNPFNIKEIMANLVNTDFDELRFESENLAQQINLLTSGSGGATMTDAQQVIADNLRKERQHLEDILALETMADKYESGVGINNILNFSMICRNLDFI